ncbi:WD40 repeat-like protein, partial [Schizophyllum commune H4-8]
MTWNSACPTISRQRFGTPASTAMCISRTVLSSLQVFLVEVRGAYTDISSTGLPFVREFTIFLKRNFLFWLETCSWTGLSFQPAKLLQHISTAAQRFKVADLHDFAVDCIRFEEYFQEAISQSPPQAYVSGLKLAPRSSRVGRLYRARFSVPINISGHARTRGWPGIKPKLEDHPRAFDQMTCATFSLDGKFIAVGFSGGIVRIWDAETLVQVGQDLEGHIDTINSVAFSPDRKRVASGSQDGTMRIWDVETQRQCGDVLRLHSDEITCVVFSSDGKYIVTGSVDGTVRIWD